MKRRSVFIALIAVLIVSTLVPVHTSAVNAKATTNSTGDHSDARVKFNFNADWKFIKEDVKGAEEPDFDDSDWETVSTPHSFNDVDTFDNFMEGGHNGERSMYTGKTWYRKHFKIDEKYKDKKVFIEFEAARQTADVYINGTKLEEKNENGFIPFGYDLTPYLHTGDKENVLAVMVDNTFPYKADGTDDVLSWHDSHWHPTHGGLYRNVYLHVTDKLHVTLPLYSFLETQGTYVYASNITKETADVTVEAEVFNEYDTPKPVEYIVEIEDREGNVVLSMNDNKEIAAGEKYIFSKTGTLEDPHRWSPEYPYLYKAITKLQVAGKVVDVYETPLGIRTSQFTNDQGFFINGRHVKLQGWGQRPTNEWAGLASAYPDWMHDFTIKMMKDAGANFIRWGHSAGAPVAIESADKYGMITLQPGVDGEGSTVGGVYSDVAYEIRADAFRDMIIYFRNNPSILMWELGNQSVPEEEARTLKEQAETWDPHGERVLASRRSDSTMGKFIDVSIGTEGSWELKGSGKPVVEGEYNREEAARRVWDRSTPGYEDYTTAPGSTYNLTTEEFAKNQAKQYAKIDDPAHSGGANWIFSDSTSHGRVYSEVARVSGEVDAVRLPKEAYFTTKAIFRDDPQVHIIGHWNYPEDTVKDMYVMSNAEKVELLVNGESKGFGTKSDNYLFTFEDIQWEEGVIKALAYDDDDQVVATQEKKTTGEPAAVKLTPITGPEGLKADGSDVLLIDAEVVDEEGNRVPTYEGRIDFTMSGPGIWRGGYNSGKEHSTNNEYLDIEAGINRVAVRSTLHPGTIEVTGVIDGLETDSIKIESKPVTIKNGLSTELPLTPPYELGDEPPIGDGPDDSVPPPSGPEPQLIKDFSYSGAHESGGVKVNTKNGDLIFSDREYEFKDLPVYLLGGEYIQAANDDKAYQALDLMNFTVSKESDVYIAHDDRLPRPDWLLEEFTDIGEKIVLDEDGNEHSLFHKKVDADTTLTLGGNQEGTNISSSNMYTVFVKETEKRDMLAYEVSEDTWVSERDPEKNYGFDTEMSIKNDPRSPEKLRHRIGYVQFDLSQIEYPDQVQSASFAAFGRTQTKEESSNYDGKTPLSIAVHELKNPSAQWDEGTLTWNNRPELGSILSTNWVHPAPEEEAQWYHWDVSEAINKALKNGQDTVSLAIWSDVPYIETMAKFITKEGATPYPYEYTTAPKLKIVYGEPEDVTVSKIERLVDDYEQDGEFANENVAHSLRIHLTAVSLYEEKEVVEKVVRHMEGFKLLLDHQKENKLISEKAYSELQSNAEALIKKWQ